MRITEIQGTNMELTSAIQEYVTQKIESLERFTKRFDPCDVAVELGKTSDHHNKGDVFFVKLTMTIPGDIVRVSIEKDDLYAAIDEAKDDMKRQCIDRKEKIVDSRINTSGTEEDAEMRIDDDEEEEDDFLINDCLE